MDTTRRKFIQTASLGAIGVGLAACTPVTQEKEPVLQENNIAPLLPQIGLQLWTVRESITQDVYATLDQLAAIGFKGVETAFWPEGLSLQTAAEALKQAGLSVFSIHCELPLDAERQDQFLEMAEVYACDTLVWHGWPEDARYASTDGLKALEEEFQQCAEFAAKYGKQLGFHNHWWEFRTIAGQSETPFEQLLVSLPESIFFELDTYWIKVAGKDPAKMIEKWGKRAKLLHLKDGPAVHDQPMTALGQGVQDFAAIQQAALGNVDWHIIEIDECSGNMMTAVRESFDYLRQNGMGRV
ncbi:MAG: sugar phosphate isomerase/epimerase [Bacteroidota bacterium]